MPGFRNDSVGEIKVDTKGSTVSTNNINFSALENLNVMNEHISPSEAETIDLSAILPTDGDVNVMPADPRLASGNPSGGRRELKDLSNLDLMNGDKQPVPVPDPIGEDRRRMDEEAGKALEELNRRRNGENPVPVPDPIGEDRKRMEEQEKKALEDLRRIRNGGSIGEDGGGSW